MFVRKTKIATTNSVSRQARIIIICELLILLKHPVTTVKLPIFRQRKAPSSVKDDQPDAWSFAVAPRLLAEVGDDRERFEGSKCSFARSGPRFAVVIRIRISFGEFFAYSANTSK
jgi:hypothetical protein